MLSLIPPFSYLVVLLFLLDPSSATEEEAVVVTSNGPLKGKRLQVGSGAVTAYLGIPYAEPPVGILRFQKPQPHQPWSHVLEATNFGNSCHQETSYSLPYSTIWVANKPFSEDCLFLNIWVPYPQPTTPAPVLVWIHGGGYIAGAGSLDLNNGAFLAATENVIVASMNYRLGVLGFLFFPPDAPGNMGLWDQQLAVKWLKENAAIFGGDPARLTLFGHSAGAASVGFHLLSPTSQPLFARAVLQSGAPNAPWAWKDPEKLKQYTLKIGHLLGCPNKNNSNVVSCLQEMEMKDNRFDKFDFLFLPTIDGEFLPGHPLNLLDSGLIQAKPLLAGVTGDDGSVYVLYSVPSAIESDGKLTWEQLLEGLKRTVQKRIAKDIKAIARKYSENGYGPEHYRRALAQFSKDYFFVCPLVELAAKTAEAGSSVYVYSFNHHISGFIWHEWMGAAHGVELPYLFGILSTVLGTNQSLTEVDIALSHKMMRYWTEFARSGNPTGSISGELQWPLYNATEQNFFCISTEVPQVLQPSPAQHCDFLAKHFLDETRQSLFPEDERNKTRT
ncbi:cholinesterase-like isoform X2 [Eublepharis macularius]|uniref:Carboxylic ester hydrolase n=1 Tax=Eublepharis macularius TaxID=481883 RepID=A0AA97KY20_EUBMA|nr:cholinesterase-like isoform X2 [Eublepharis macularius]